MMKILIKLLDLFSFLLCNRWLTKNVLFKIARGNLKEGEKLYVLYSRMKMQTFVEHRHIIKIPVDAFATYDYLSYDHILLHSATHEIRS